MQQINKICMKIGKVVKILVSLVKDDFEDRCVYLSDQDGDYYAISDVVKMEGSPWLVAVDPTESTLLVKGLLLLLVGCGCPNEEDLYVFGRIGGVDGKDIGFIIVGVHAEGENVVFDIVYDPDSL